MSIILITKHNENIYDIFKGQEAMKTQYKPKFRAHVDPKILRPDFFLPKKKYGVMGTADMDLPDPHNYLRKRTGQPCYVKERGEKEPSRPCHPNKLSEVPKTKDVIKAYHPSRSDKDFVDHNVKKVLGQPGKEPRPYIVLDRLGNKQSLTELEPRFVKVPHFGKTPKYLKRFIAQREKEYQLKKDASSSSQPICKYITRHRREELLNGLKQNWEELQLQYQGLPILTDTIPKIMKKAKIEKQLKQLERDIVLLERHPYIYVYEDGKLP